MLDYEKEGVLHEMFRRQAASSPDDVAVVSADGRKLTYKQLDQITDVLASKLSALGVVPDSTVGIFMERCVEYAVSYIAILKAGGAYMPIELAYPQPLIESILSDAKPVAVITFSKLQENIKDASMTVLLDEGWVNLLEGEGHKAPFKSPDVSFDNLAYVVYSSGTTGKPKGIQCPHRGAMFSYSWRYKSFPYKGEDREACNVFFVWEMLRPLLKGAALYIIPDNVIYDPVALCDFLQKNAITRMLFTPSLFEAVLDADIANIQEALQTMREIVFCGEVVTTYLLERCVNTLPWIQFVNLYSISECHDVATADLTQFYNTDPQMKQKKFCPVGKLLPGVTVIILDDDLKPNPVGVSGEIYVAGPTLAIGYLNRPELNETRFIARPADVGPGVGPRLYKTGDWGYVLCDGSLEICGRCDTMVKVRGYSIEVQAVEAALLDLAMINACVVTVEGNEGEDKFLIAYIVPEGQTTKKQVRAELKKRLPFYMIPSYFVVLNKIPIHATSGKLDKKCLPLLDVVSGGEQDPESLPSTETEKKLVSLWADVLTLKWVDVQESFFDLGGHSLLASKLLSKVNQSFDVTMAVHDLFLNNTITAMAAFIDGKHGEGEPSSTITKPPKVDLSKEVDIHDVGTINMDMQLRAFWRAVQYSNKSKWFKGHILLTGVTGFLGSFLLRDLLLKTKAHIYCLVRELPDTDGMTRIKTTLARFGLIGQQGEEQQKVEQYLTYRVTAVYGDVTLINLGTNSDDYNYLLTDIDFIIHAAASVNLIYPYQALHGPNVLGTQNVIQFAITMKVKPIHYISTDAVFPEGLTDCCEDDDMMLHAGHLTDGYSQSKWVAEQIVLRARNKGLPVAVYRLGNMSGDSKTGVWNPADFILLILQGCISIKAYPDIDWNIEMTPVDFVSDVITRLTQDIMSSMGKVFHCINTQLIKSRWLFEWMKCEGYQLDLVSYDEWITRLSRTVPDDVTEGQYQDHTKLVDFLKSTGPEYLTNLSCYGNTNLKAVLATLGLHYPEVDRNLLKTYFHGLAKQKFIPNPIKTTSVDVKPLTGKVAIVTGASSGIGKAVATHLAEAGAKVALAARRADKLSELKAFIEKEGGVAISVATDVTKREQVVDLVSHTETSLGPVDILVNNAGCMYYTLMKNIHWDEWDRQLDINCKGVMNGIGAVLPGMLKRSKGHIINMSSDAGRRGFAGLAVYSGTKFFVEGLSQGMRCELADSGIRITCIQPGDVKTELGANNTDQQAQSQYDGSSNVKILDPDDIGRAVVYAASQPDHVGVNEILIEPREAPI